MEFNSGFKVLIVKYRCGWNVRKYFISHRILKKIICERRLSSVGSEVLIAVTDRITASCHAYQQNRNDSYCKLYILRYTGRARRNVPDFWRMFLMLKYTDITQNTYNQI